ncbi:hypothetical protein [Paenibacillus sp. NEAU-GSW1]|uniref:hypothetical protein n=1 Tax=Paenibacillus sp. NEAU-GSW1 TaxID=2682486 RepID=UPI0012E0FA7E|nr:hypothetical protein [Paenibacillus sp. NEAU-GSW1]MUT68426.1 hypothetical protein [Paenibacillus sp. NEAU-GSW1]
MSAENAGQGQQQVAPVISVKDWLITILLLAIPIVNIIMLFVWAFGGNTNPSKANYAKAALIWALIGIVIYVVLFVIILGSALSINSY